MTSPRIVRVRGAAPYDVVIGHGVSDQVVDLLAPAGGGGHSRATRVAVVYPDALAGPAAHVLDALEKAGTRVLPIGVPDGEAAKTAAVATSCWETLGRFGLTRSDLVIGVGGGATTDLAGFVAATFLRGVACVLVPTSLLGMVDAAVGGKTGINTSHGKNLVGSFHEPRGVLCDLDLLQTVPVRELRSGLAEVVKCGFIADPAILELVETQPTQALDPTSQVLAELVERAVSVKSTVVAADLRESTSAGSRVGREALNYGHTLGHAIELAEEYSIPHGEGVAIGMVFVAEVAARLGLVDTAMVVRHRRVLELVGLPTSYRADRWPELSAAMRKDKKARGDVLRLIVLEGLARPVVVEGAPEDVLAAAYRALAPVG